MSTLTSHPEDINEETVRCCGPKRYILTGVIFAGFFIAFSLRANMSIAIIVMTSNRTMTTAGGEVIQFEPEFPWDSKTQSLVLSMNSYGFLFSIIAGAVTRRCGGITTYGCALLSAGLITVLNPTIVRFNFHLFLLSRLMEEICAGSTMISISEIWSRWTPKKERSKMLALASTGLYVSNAFSFPICGFVSRLWGWPSAFYFTGAMAMIIALIMMSFFSNDPFTDKCISKKELQYFTQHSENSKAEKLLAEKITYHWKEVLTTKSVWALFVAKIGNIGGYTFVSICLPLYVKDMTGKEIHSIGILSGIPNVANIITTPLAGYLADYIQNENILSTGNVHKLYTLIGLGFSAVCLFLMPFTDNFTLIMIFLILFKILISINYLIIELLPLYMAPDHPSLITSITFYGAGAGMLITTTLIGYMVTSHDPYQWNVCLTSMGLIMLTSCVVFLIFGSSENQHLFRIEKQEQDVPNTKALLPLSDLIVKDNEDLSST